MEALVRLFVICSMTLAMFAAPASAQVMSVERWVEQWDHASQQWVRLPEGADRLVAARAAAKPQAIATYGPFQVIDGRSAAMVGVTDGSSPRHFAAMLRDYPELQTLRMVDVAGTDDDRGNMLVGRMIRAAGLETYVPAGGSVRSGGVELFLAGATRRIDDGAEFAVHSWLDNYGREADDFAANAPENRIYLDYYREMGMADGQARAFYDMTNSVPHADARWLTAQDMRGWVGSAQKASAPPTLAYLDVHLDGRQALP